MSSAEIKTLREERASIITQMRELSETAGKEKRSLTDEEDKKWRSMEADEDRLRKDIERREKLSGFESELAITAERREQFDYEAKKDDRPTSADYRNVLQGWAAGRHHTPDHLRSAQKTGQVGDMSKPSWKLRFKKQAPKSYSDIQNWITRTTTDTNVTTSTTLGPEAIQNEPMAGIERALLSFGGMREASRIIRTNTGATLQMPTNNDTGNAAVIVAQATGVDVNNIQFGQTTLGAFKYSSQFVKASIEFMQDLSFDFDSWIVDVLGERVARGTNSHFSTGAGTSEPFGVQTQSIMLTTQAQITYDTLTRIEHAVDPSYRRLPGTRWMFHDSILRRIKGLTDSQGRLLWVPGVASGEPDTILGYPYTINQDLNTDATGSTTIQILFGDFNHYIIRDVMDVELRRLDERFAETGTVAFFTFSRHDGVTLQPSTVNPPIVGHSPTT